MMEINILADADAVAREAALFIASEARLAVAARGKFVLAVSGGHTPWHMLRHLSRERLPWKVVHIAQVDERVAPENDPDRNLVHLRESLLEHSAMPADNLHAMPVDSSDLEIAASNYERILGRIAGTPPVLDLAHLGLGPDGHTASLVPGDSVCDVADRDVWLSGAYQGRRRMTLTFPMLNRSRRILWVITGEEKSEMLARLQNGDASIPAGRISKSQSVVFADAVAAKDLKPRKG